MVEEILAYNKGIYLKTKGYESLLPNMSDKENSYSSCTWTPTTALLSKRIRVEWRCKNDKECTGGVISPSAFGSVIDFTQ